VALREAAATLRLWVAGQQLLGCWEGHARIKRQQAPQNRVARLGVQLLVGNRTYQGLGGLARGLGLMPTGADRGDVARPVVVQLGQELGGPLICTR